MILTTILVTAILVLAMLLGAVLLASGAGVVVLFGDIIAFGLIVAMVVKLITRKK